MKNSTDSSDIASGHDLQRYALAILVGLTLLGFFLRVHHLGASAYRGDEAFAVRYWAASPAETFANLAGTEPHPIGIFLAFWAWKSLVGDGEFAMRMLSVLVNLLGVPAMYALARRLVKVRTVALIAALLWAINPNLIWQSQDARNYAMWAALSLISMWLMLRAADSPARRLNWLLYIIFATLTLYTFFLEAFLVVVHALYILLWRRAALRGWLIAAGIIAVLLIPWFGQIWALAHSAYQGTATRADLATFLRFLPVMYLGEPEFAGQTSVLGLTVIWILTAASLYLVGNTDPRQRRVLLLWLLVPGALLVIASVRLDVFRARYLISVTPALLIPTAYVIFVLATESLRMVYRTYMARGIGPIIGAGAIVIGFILPVSPFALATTLSLSGYYAYQKAPDWYTLRDFLRANATAADTVIMTSLDPTTGYTDPAFAYYYSGPAQVIALPHPQFDTTQVVKQVLDQSRTVWFVLVGDNTAPIEGALTENGQLISMQAAGRSFFVHEYRGRQPKASEMAVPLALSIGEGTLVGYTVEGETRTGSVLNVLLFWDHAPKDGLKGFVHLIGSPRADGSPLWTQDDHPPRPSDGSSGRDVFRLDLASVPPGDYDIEIGLYDPNTTQRFPILDRTSGKSIGDSTVIAHVRIDSAR